MWAQTVYHVTDLGTLGGARSTASAISSNGNYVSGNSLNASSTSHAFSYSVSGAAMLDLGALGSAANSSQGYGINNSGQVAGYSANPSDLAFLYSGGTMTSLGTVGSGATSFGYGINNSGQVVGYTNTSSANSHQFDAFLYSGGTMHDLGLPAGGTSSYASAINDSGEIVGYYTPDSATTHAFTLIGGVYTDLGTLNGTASGTTSSAAGVSSNGLVSGSSVRSDGTTHAFLYTGGKMVDLGSLGGTSRASSVNASGDVVGEYLLTGTGFRAFLYSGGAMADLNGMLDSASAGYTISDAVGISDSGVIVATGTVPGGQTHALLLSPVTVQSQTITFDAIPNQIFGISPFAIAAESSSGLPVAYASSTPAVCATASLVVTLKGPGTCTIAASQGGNTSYGPATPVTQSFTVSLANPSGTLTASAGSPLAAGASPQAVAVGYFHGAGLQDLAIANNGDGTVTVLLGNGSGGFTAAPKSPFKVGTDPASVAVGDFNGDGFDDLAIANGGDGTVTVLLGNGQGGFTAAPDPFKVGTPSSVVVADFNGDGIQDLATANFNSGTVTVLLGNGQGGFTAATGGPFAVGTSPVSIAVADFNKDGIPDLAIANNGDGTVTVLLGNGQGGFTSPTGNPFTVGTLPVSVAVGDFNGDGIPDFATANYGSNSVTVLLGSVSGGFSAAPGSPFTVANPTSVAAADLNGDGIPDLAVSLHGGGVTVLLGNGSDGFTAAAGSPFAVGTTPEALAVGAFSGVGIEGLAAANSGSNNATVLLGGKASTSSVLSTTSASKIAAGQPVPLTLAVADTVAAFDLPTGTATFLDGATILGTASQTASPYTFTVSSLTAGSHTLTASYGGDTRSLGSTSNGIAILALSPCDVNRDGVTNVQDVQRMINEGLGTAAAANDLDADGVVNVVDVQIVINASISLGCSAS